MRKVLEVLYSPIKAFEEIIKKPDIKGPLLILVLILLATLGAQYVTASRFFLQVRTPANEEWTESTEFIALWTSNGNISRGEDRIIGNYSVESSASNITSIWLKIGDIGPFSFSGGTGFEGLSFRVKWIHTNATSPSSDARFQLISGDESSYFQLDLVDSLKPSNQWANLSVLAGSESPNWTSSGSPDWESITGLALLLQWTAEDFADLNLRIDDLYIYEFVPFTESDSFGNLIVPSLIGETVFFFINWVVYAGILLLTVKLFQEKSGPWQPFLIIIGYVFIANVVYILASAALLATLPTLRLPMQAWPPETAEELYALQVIIQDNWYPALSYQLGALLPYVVDAWIGLLLAIVIRSLCATTWKKAVVIAVVAAVLSFFVRTLFI